MTLWLLAAVALAGFLLWLEPISREDARRLPDPSAEVASRSGTKKEEPARRTDPKPPEAKPPQAKVAEAKPPEAKPPEAKAPEAKPPEPKPAVQPPSPPAREATVEPGRNSSAPPGEVQPPPVATPAGPRAEAPREKSPEAVVVERAFTPPQPAPKPLFSMPPNVKSRDITPDEEASARTGTAPRTLALNREASRTAVPSPQPPKPPAVPPTEPVMARAAIVIDDFGPDLEAARKFLALPIQITFSVMPFETHSKEICELVHSQGHEVILHLPMEPQSFPAKKASSNMLTLAMGDDEMRKFISHALFTTPYVSGVNNHQGSRFTEKVHAMAVVMTELRTRGLYFFDSRTSPKSVGAAVARKYSIPTGQRDIFLDHSQSEVFVRSQVDLLIRKARVEGSTLAIGHPHAVTLKALTEAVDRFRAEGIRIVPLRELMSLDQPTKDPGQIPLGRD